jgi:hypothetical protein
MRASHVAAYQLVVGVDVAAADALDQRGIDRVIRGHALAARPVTGDCILITAALRGALARPIASPGRPFSGTA